MKAYGAKVFSWLLNVLAASPLPWKPSLMYSSLALQQSLCGPPGLPITGSSIRQRCYASWFGSPSVVHALLPSLVFWQLWKNCYQAFFESTSRPPSILFAAVQHDLQCILLAYGYFARVNPLGIASYCRRKRVNVCAVQWLKPTAGLAKLNSDEACRGNPGLSGGGGVIRDDRGGFIYAYASFFGDSTNTLAEIRALYQGVRWLYFNGFSGASVEMDSKLLFNCLTQGHKPPWSCL